MPSLHSSKIKQVNKCQQTHFVILQQFLEVTGHRFGFFGPKIQAVLPLIALNLAKNCPGSKTSILELDPWPHLEEESWIHLGFGSHLLSHVRIIQDVKMHCKYRKRHRLI